MKKLSEDTPKRGDVSAVHPWGNVVAAPPVKEILARKPAVSKKTQARRAAEDRKLAKDDDL